MELHRPARDTVAGLEKELRDALHTAGYRVLNEIKSRHPIDELLMAEVLKAFSGQFSRLIIAPTGLRPTTKLVANEVGRNRFAVGN